MATDKKAAAALVASQFEPLVAQRYEGVDKPTAKIVTTYRVRHNLIVKAPLKTFNQCIHSKLNGHDFAVEGAPAVENIRRQREAFKTASADCKAEVERKYGTFKERNKKA